MHRIIRKEDFWGGGKGGYNRDHASILSFSALVRSPGDPKWPHTRTDHSFISSFIHHPSGTVRGPWHTVPNTADMVPCVGARSSNILSLGFPPKKKKKKDALDCNKNDGFNGTFCLGDREKNKKQQTNSDADMDCKMHP